MTNEILKPETKEQLKNYVIEIERLNEKKAQLQSEIKEIFDSAKSKGFDVKNIREVIKVRKLIVKKWSILKKSVNFTKTF